MKISSNVIRDSVVENNFPHKLLLTNTQVSKLRKAFTNGSSANVELSKTQLHKIGQSRGYLGSLLGPLLKTGFPLIRNVLKQLAKSVLIPLGLTVAPSETDVAVHKNLFGLGNIALTISNKEMNDIVKIIKPLEDSGLLMKGVSETIKIEAKKQNGEFLRMLVDPLGASLLRNL